MVFVWRVLALLVVFVSIPAVAQESPTDHYQFYCPPLEYLEKEYKTGLLGGPSLEDAVEFMDLLCYLQDLRDYVISLDSGTERDEQEVRYHALQLNIRELALVGGYHWGEVMFSTAPTLLDTQRFFRIMRDHLNNPAAPMHHDTGFSWGYSLTVSEEFQSVSFTVIQADYMLIRLCRFEPKPLDVDPLECPVQSINWRPLQPFSFYTMVGYDGLGFIRGKYHDEYLPGK